MDSEKVTFMPKLLRPNFSTKSAGMLGCYGVNLGRNNFGIKVIFSESPGSIHYSCVFGFLGPRRSLPEF